MFKVGQEVRCKDEYKNAGVIRLTKGTTYTVLREIGLFYVDVLDDRGCVNHYPNKFFEAIKKVGCDKMKYDHVSVSQFVIGSLHPENGFSMRPEPKTHRTEKAAKHECERLAKLEPTKKFVYLEIKGACRVQETIWE